MEEEPDSRFYSSSQNDDLDDYIEVPEDVKVPESSSSPEIIGLDEDQDSAPQDMDKFDIAPAKEPEDNFESPIPDSVPLIPESPYIPDSVPLIPESPYIPSVEDIHVLPTSPATSSGSPSRPGIKSVEAPRASGYLSFLNALHPVVLYLIYWCDPKLTLLSLVMTMVVLLTLYVNTFLHTVTLVLLAAMITSLLYIVTKVAIDSFYNRQIVNPFNKYLEMNLSISDDHAAQVAREIARKLNCYLKCVMKIVFFNNTLTSLKFMVFLFLLSYVTNCFDVFTTLFLGIIDLYTIPFVYKKYQSAIDSQINNTLFKVTTVYSKIVEKVPFLPKLKSE